MEQEGFETETGFRCLGGCIGSDEERDRWIDDKILSWVAGAEIMGKAAQADPHSAFCGFQKSFQQEWQRVQRAVPGIEDHFGPVFRAMQ